MNNGLSADHTFVLRLLEDCKMDAQTLAKATFNSAHQVQRIVEDLIRLELVEREWDGSRCYYRRRT